MMRHLTIGTALLFAANSCVPAEFARVRPPRPVVIADAQILLARLALAPVAGPSVTTAEPAGRTMPSRAAPSFTLAGSSDDDAARALGCLTAAVYYEARSEPTDGQRAVAQVVLNRVRDRAFPASICGVVYQGAARATGCQFSFTCDGSTRRARDPAAWTRAQAIARAALDGAVYAPVGSATFFHTDAILPWWAPSMSKIGAVGAHVFYRWRGRMERALAFRQQYAAVEPLIGAGAPQAVLTGYALTEGSVTVHRGQPGEDVTGVRIHLGRVSAPAETGFTVGEEDDGAI